MVETIASDPSETATTDSEAPLVVQQFRSAGVDLGDPAHPLQRLLPGAPGRDRPEYYPKLLLSDYESSIEVVPRPAAHPLRAALNGQEGVTTETLGGVDDDRLHRGQGATTPGCATAGRPWHKAYPQIPPGDTVDYIEEQGPIVELVPGHPPVRRRGPGRRTRPRPAHLRDRPVQDHRLPGHRHTGAQLRAGQAVRADRVQGGAAAHQRAAVVGQCKLTSQGKVQGTCWVTVQPFTPLPTG